MNTLFYKIRRLSFQSTNGDVYLDSKTYDSSLDFVRRTENSEATVNYNCHSCTQCLNFGRAGNENYFTALSSFIYIRIK